ncbi:amidohydrolase family protein [Natronosporangium hydrolyticum]|uniref:Amidohydrolase family protein n=1 Tax=Natronosporangium hydrolyticum TaxID=2811111 RepID=A0A895YPP7_9ACTN|nr:amidohydrolase family protein [Natronosporangium hydrolyticum]QSB16706.1 amidohydrolase family protein [Natronosporangium hydrolyticum]
MGTTTFTNVRVFDGTADALTEPTTVTVTDDRIVDVGALPTGEIIDGPGHTLLPGLIDAHWHSTLADITILELVTTDSRYAMLRAARQAEQTLQRGFTTVRDLGGPSFPLKRAIDEGVVPGPRIYPSGAMISQTSGHGDFRTVHDLPLDPSRPLPLVERVGISVIADGADAVLRAAREQLLLGATQVKVMAGGGASTLYDPLDATQYTEREIHAAVEAAANWGTYVTVHAYTSDSVQQAIRAGVRCVEHGQLVDEQTVAMMAEHDIWWSLQPFLDDEDANPMHDPAGRAKQRRTHEGTDVAYRLAIEYGIKIAWGTDTLFDPHLTTRQGAQLAKLSRWFRPAQVLRMATHDNAALLAMCGARDPYPAPLGVVAPGAYADLLLVAGDPIVELDLIADPANFAIIMQGGKLVKNTLAAGRPGAARPDS